MRKSPSSSPRVALAFPAGNPHAERILRGIVDYGRDHGGWQLDLDLETGQVPLASLRGWRGDGVIAMITSLVDERRAARLGVPVVNAANSLLAPRLPSILTDNLAVGALAAQHLLERGFRRFGYYGLDNLRYGRDRGLGFERALADSGHETSFLWDTTGLDSRQPWRWDRTQLARWLRRLQPPVGVFAVHDYRGRMVIEACRRLGLRVPDDVAVIGVNDDALACTLVEPPLTSIALPGRSIGYEAARLLDRLMCGHAPPPTPLVLSPGAVVTRASTDAVPIADRPTAEAVRLLRTELTLGIDAIARKVGLSRRTLETRFRAHLATTPHAFRLDVRIARARLMLRDPARPALKAIAAACGFGDPRRLNVAFEEREGMSPRRYRQGP